MKNAEKNTKTGKSAASQSRRRAAGALGAPLFLGETLIAEGLVPNQWALFIEGGSELPGGGMPFADGLLCVGGPYAGPQFVKVNAAGVAGPIEDIWYFGLGWGAHLPSDTSYYQRYHREPLLPACGAKWNLTNGLKVNWRP